MQVVSTASTKFDIHVPKAKKEKQNDSNCNGFRVQMNRS